MIKLKFKRVEIWKYLQKLNGLLYYFIYLSDRLSVKCDLFDVQSKKLWSEICEKKFGTIALEEVFAVDVKLCESNIFQDSYHTNSHRFVRFSKNIRTFLVIFIGKLSQLVTTCLQNVQKSSQKT